MRRSPDRFEPDMGHSRIAFSATAIPMSNFTKMIYRRQTLSGLCRLTQPDRMLAVLLARYSTSEDPERRKRIRRVRRGKAFCDGDGWRRFTFYTRRNHDCKTRSSDKFEDGYSKGEDSMWLTVTVARSKKQANSKIQIHTGVGNYISKPIIVRIVADIAARPALNDRRSGPRLRLRPIRDALCSP